MLKWFTVISLVDINTKPRVPWMEGISGVVPYVSALIGNLKSLLGSVEMTPNPRN